MILQTAFSHAFRRAICPPRVATFRTQSANRKSRGSGEILDAPNGGIGSRNPLRYRGYYFDKETGFYYLQSRYYDPIVTRFLNADSYGSTGQGFLGYNMFAYCGNKPLISIDPTGHAEEAWKWWLDGGGGGCYTGAYTFAINDTSSMVGTSSYYTDSYYNYSTSLSEASGATSYNYSIPYSYYSNGYSVTTTIPQAEAYYSNPMSASGDVAFGFCFVAGTLVATETGNVLIEQIEAGDYVWAWDEETGDVVCKQVVETYVNEASELTHVFVNGKEIICTQFHPFYSPTKGWTEACKLRAGDILVLINGEYVVVDKVQHELLELPVKVYNFQVQDYHTYYVASGVLVHNSCGASFDASMFSTGRTIPNSLNEQIAMEVVKSDPAAGKIIISSLSDPKLPSGTVKFSQVVKWTGGLAEIHYLFHEAYGYFDFKFK